MIDLDALERGIHENRNLPPDYDVVVGITPTQVLALIAELRAARKVVEAARQIAAHWDLLLNGDLLLTAATAVELDLRIALTELEAPK